MSNAHAQKEFPTWNAIIEGKVNSDILIYGSSRAWVQVNPSLIRDSLNSTAFNLGIDGHNFYLQNLRHKMLLEFNSSPKIIIHIVDISTFQKTDELYNSDQFLPYMLWNSNIKKATSTYKGFNFLDYYIPLLRYYGKTEAIKVFIKLIIKPQSNAIERIYGYQGQNKTWNSDFKKAKEKLDHIQVVLDTCLISKFNNYLIDCKSKGIKVLLIHPPEYIRSQSFIKNRDDVISLFKDFEERLDVSFYDFSDNSISYNRNNFYNTTHLNQNGSELFTNKIIDLLKENNIEEAK